VLYIVSVISFLDTIIMQYLHPIQGRLSNITNAYLLTRRVPPANKRIYLFYGDYLQIEYQQFNWW
jgi:hypothetical protein